VKLLLAKAALAPLLLMQGRQVRRKALRLPEAAGTRHGEVGDGELMLRLLILGDSSGAGVGASHQDEALAGRLSRALARRLGGRVRWQLVARTGHNSAQALRHLQSTDLQAADVLVTALGVNDVVGQVGPQSWLQTLQAIDAHARQVAGVRYTLHSAIPPMHAFPLLPQPLRWWMGAQAMRLNQRLGLALAGTAERGVQAMPDELDGAQNREAVQALMAPDGFHPGPAGYRLWAESLSERIALEAFKDA